MDYDTSNKKRLTLLLSFATLLVLMQAVFLMPPRDFPENELIHLKKGWTVSEIASYLEEEGVIRSPLLFKILVKITGTENKLVAGYYVMTERPTTLEIFTRLVKGQYNLVPTKVTIPEGATTAEVAMILEKAIPDFPSDEFFALAKEKEGFLFPDTYFFLPGITSEEIIEVMHGNFLAKIAALEKRIEDSGNTLDEVVTMASLLEEEARTPESKRLISGILWKRLKTGMKLQVDAVFPYIMGKNTFDLTKADLQTDSPYNTYRYKGLPPGPISNPGLESITAALSPESSPYWFYLSDMEGEMHYAKNYDQHLKNRDRYLP